MSRFSNPATEAAFNQEHVDYAVACSLDFTSGMVRAHLGLGEMIINGETYLGIGAAGSGGFGSLSAIVERPDSRDMGELRLAMSGVNLDLIDTVPKREEYRGRYGAVYLVAINSQTMRPIEPVEAAIFEGFMDLLTYDRKQGSASIQVTLKHYDSRFAKTIGLMYTDAHQKSLGFTTDRFFETVAEIQNREVYWGGRSVRGGTTLYPGGGSPSDEF